MKRWCRVSSRVRSPWLSRIAGGCWRGETPWGQPWTPVLTVPHVRDALSELLMAVWCTCRRLSRGRPVHRQLLHNELLDLTTIVPATACHQRNYVEAYSRYRRWQAFSQFDAYPHGLWTTATSVGQAGASPLPCARGLVTRHTPPSTAKRGQTAEGSPRLRQRYG
jgi:hypothetical protein